MAYTATYEKAISPPLFLSILSTRGTREQDEGRGRGLGTKGMRQKEGGDNDTEPNLGGEAHFIQRNLPVMQLLQHPPDASVYCIHRIVPLCSIFLFFKKILR